MPHGFMHRFAAAGGLAALWCGMLGSVPADAAFHLWFIKEIYSNQSGSVQFVELFTTSAGQEFVKTNNKSLTSNTNTFPFPADTPSPTNNHHVLLATAGFGSIAGGATPDYTIPSNFFNPAGDTIKFATTVDTKTFASAPTDGINSLNYTGFGTSSVFTAANSPRNYAGSGGSVSLPPPTGDYNGNHSVDAADYVLWRNTLTQSAFPAGSGADGNSSGTIDSGDFTFWRARFGNAAGSGTGLGAATAAPEPAAGRLLLVALLALRLGSRKR